MICPTLKESTKTEQLSPALTLPLAILNLPCKPSAVWGDLALHGYKQGHHDARLAASDLVLERADELVALAALAAPPAKPLTYLRWRACEVNEGHGNVGLKEWFEECRPDQVGDDASPAFPVYQSPVTHGAQAQVFFSGEWKPASAEAFYCTSEKNRRVVDRAAPKTDQHEDDIAVQFFATAMKAKIGEVRALLEETHGFASTSKRSQENINAALDLLDEIAAAPVGLTDAARDVLAERRRQVEAEGWTPEHDDQYTGCELARAAATYATCSHMEQLMLCGQPVWPWHPDWWKRSSYRRDLEKAGALILAEIERLDRLALTQPKE
jgi:hypothetical protein